MEAVGFILGKCGIANLASGPHDTQYCMEDPEQAWLIRIIGALPSDMLGTNNEYFHSFWLASSYPIKDPQCLKPYPRALLRDTVRTEKLSTSPVFSARSYPNMDPQCSNHIQGSINAVTIHSEKQSDSYDEKAKENEEEEKDNPKISMSNLTPHDPSVAFTHHKKSSF
ncbi:hypothetical protein Tco_0006892 [Tanacetum coccineum]